MSLKVMVQVMETIDVTRPQQAVLLAMAENASDDGSRCFPSLDLIAWKTGYKTRNVVDIVRELRHVGVLEEVAPASGTRPIEYHIHLNKAAKKPAFDEWRRMNGRHAKRDAGVHSHDAGVHSHDAGVHSHDNTTRENAPRTVREPSTEPSKNHFPASSDAGSEGREDEPTVTDTDGDDPGNGQPTDGVRSRLDTAAGFAAWWQAYPQRLRDSGTLTRGSRAVSLDLWRQLSAAHQAAAMAGLRGYVAERGDKPVDAERYLRRRLWRDYVDDPASDAGPSGGVGRSPAVIRLDAEIERIRTVSDVRYMGTTGLRQRKADLAELERQRCELTGQTGAAPSDVEAAA